MIEKAGLKYRKQITGRQVELTFDEDAGTHTATIEVDVYDVLTAFGVVCPAAGQAIKKILFAGLRGGKGGEQDLREAIEAVERAIQLLDRKGDSA